MTSDQTDMFSRHWNGVVSIHIKDLTNLKREYMTTFFGEPCQITAHFAGVIKLSTVQPLIHPDAWHINMQGCYPHCELVWRSYVLNGGKGDQSCNQSTNPINQ